MSGTRARRTNLLNNNKWTDADTSNGTHGHMSESVKIFDFKVHI